MVSARLSSLIMPYDLRIYRHGHEYRRELMDVVNKLLYLLQPKYQNLPLLISAARAS